MDLSIVIVNWNSREYLRGCLESIATASPRTSYEIIVIDSGSFDGCACMLAEEFPDVRFIQSDENVGFARANNRAFEASVGKVILFLNPDTELAGPAIDVMHACLAVRPDAGVVGCKLLNADGSLQTSCIQALPTIANQLLDSDLLRAWTPKSRLWGMAPLFETGSGVREVEAVSGACLMIHRTTFELVGRFSEDYFMYAEDIDLSYKVRLAGSRNFHVPEATVIHHGGSSSEQAVSTFSAVMMREATWRFLRKTRGRPYGVGYRTAMFGAALLRLLLLSAAMMLPLNESRGRRGRSLASFDKWLAVLRWTLKRDDLVKRFYPPVPFTISG